MPPTFAVVGANLAGGTAAGTLREEGFEGRLILVGAEPTAPYERPPLSKEFLRGEAAFEASLLRPASFWEERDIECRFGVRAIALDAEHRTITLDDGDTVAYDKILVATGVRNRTLAIPGADLAGVHSLRTVAEAEAIRAEMGSASHAVVVGMGFIGAEVAATLRTKGLEITVIEPLPGPIIRALGPEAAAVVSDIHHDHGVVMHFGDGVAAFEGAGRAERVVTSSGRRIDCDFVVVGVGTIPVTELLAATGVHLDNGVVVDAQCRTNVEGIYAAGDVANHFHPAYGRHIRVEHWQNALKQGAAAARSMLGSEDPYDEVHWFWSDQYGDNIQRAGILGEWQAAVIRGDIDARRFIAFFLSDGRLQGALTFNMGRDLRRGLPLIKAKSLVDPARLADPGADVRTAAR